MLLLTWMDLQGLAVLTPLERNQPGPSLASRCLLNASGLSTWSCLAWDWYMDMETLPKVFLRSWKDHFKYCQAGSVELGLSVPVLGPTSCCTSFSLKVFAFTKPKTGISMMYGSPDQIQE